MQVLDKRWGLRTLKNLFVVSIARMQKYLAIQARIGKLLLLLLDRFITRAMS